MTNKKETKVEKFSPEKRIIELETEIKQFQIEIQKRQQLIQNTNNEIVKFVEAIQTRSGGVVELKKLIKGDK